MVTTTMSPAKATRLAQNTVDRYFSDVSFQAQWGKGEEVKTPARRAAVKKAALVLLADANEKLSAEMGAEKMDFIRIGQAGKRVAKIADILRMVTLQGNQGCENHVEYVNDCVKCHPECQSW